MQHYPLFGSSRQSSTLSMFGTWLLKYILPANVECGSCATHRIICSGLVSYTLLFPHFRNRLGQAHNDFLISNDFIPQITLAFLKDKYTLITLAYPYIIIQYYNLEYNSTIDINRYLREVQSPWLIVTAVGFTFLGYFYFISILLSTFSHNIIFDLVYFQIV